MFRKCFIALPLMLLTSCAIIQDYVPPMNVDTSKLLMTRNIDGPLLGTTTHIYKVAKFRGCRAGLEAKEDVRLITQTASNPLISEFNEEGVQVKSGEELSIKIFTIAGQYNNCPMFAKFTPEVGKDYELRLLGRVNISPHQCKAELWSTEVGTNIIKQEDFKDFDSCLPK